jgi:hypothetical protein
MNANLGRTPFCSGDLADLSLVSDQIYPGSVGRWKETVVKRPRLPALDLDLMTQEARALKKLEHLNATYKQCVPSLIGFDPSTGTIVTEAFLGFFSAKDIHSLDPQLDLRTLIWMWKRLLGLLGWVHHLELIHGAILPPHVLFFPDNNMRGGRDQRKHSVRLVDWCYSVEINAGKLSAWVPEYTSFYPPEVKAKKYLGPWTDIYMAAKLIVYMSGRSISDFPNQIRDVLYKSLSDDYQSRYKKAGDAFESLKSAAEIEFGLPKFHRFILPL